jgi:prolyl-tRNA synthetase
MTHSDDKGLVYLRNLAPYQVVIVPIYKNDEQFDAVKKVADQIIK